MIWPKYSHVGRVTEPRTLRWLVLAAAALLLKVRWGGPEYWFPVGLFTALMVSLFVNEVFYKRR